MKHAAGQPVFYSAAGKNVCVNVQPRDLPDNVDVVVTFEGQTRLTTGSFPQQSAPASEQQQAWPAHNIDDDAAMANAPADSNAEQPVWEKPEQILPRRAPRIHSDPEGNKGISVAELLAREGRTPRRRATDEALSQPEPRSEETPTAHFARVHGVSAYAAAVATETKAEEESVLRAMLRHSDEEDSAHTPNTVDTIDRIEPADSADTADTADTVVATQAAGQLGATEPAGLFFGEEFLERPRVSTLPEGFEPHLMWPSALANLNRWRWAMAASFVEACAGTAMMGMHALGLGESAVYSNGMGLTGIALVAGSITQACAAELLFRPVVPDELPYPIDHTAEHPHGDVFADQDAYFGEEQWN